MTSQAPNKKSSLQLFVFLFAQVLSDSDFESPIRAVRKRRHPLNMVSNCFGDRNIHKTHVGSVS